MINSINSWAKGLILAIIIATIIEIILPEGNNKKYVKTIIGIYIMFIIIAPLIPNISNKKINVESFLNTEISKMEEVQYNDITIETNTYIKQTYIEKIKEDMKKKLEEREYIINSLELDIETEDDENFGFINQISLNISKIQKNIDDISTENKVDKIENVEIKISKNNTQNNNENNISIEEIKNLTDFLNSEYGTDKEKIYINK